MGQTESAMSAMPEILRECESRELAVFLDYDGTLTPIVARPELAVLAEDMRATLDQLAQGCTVAIVSGRALADVHPRRHRASAKAGRRHPHDRRRMGRAAVDQHVRRDRTGYHRLPALEGKQITAIPVPRL